MQQNIKIKVGVLIQKNRSLLLIREKDGFSKKYRWNIVKGSFDELQDADLRDTAAREAREEAMAKIELRHLLNVFFLRESHRTLVQVNFIADLVGSNFGISPKKLQKTYRAGEDIVEIKMFSTAELQELTAEDFISMRAYHSVCEWIDGKHYPLSILQAI